MNEESEECWGYWGCERLMRDVMTNDEESVMTRVKRREERECEERYSLR